MSHKNISLSFSQNELRQMLTECNPTTLQLLNEQAREVSREQFGSNIYVRGLIEISSYCRNGCRYCGINAGNARAQRYRLDADAIMSRCRYGYGLGMRTFVLQGGEDPWFTDERLVPIVESIHEKFPDCAITLSLGERSRQSYLRLFEAGASRYLLRHETYDEAHYRYLHPAEMSLSNRLQCLHYLKEIGYQTGTGIMVGSPGQTIDHLIADIRFIESLQPEMIGIGPFIPHRDTQFALHPAGSIELTLMLLSIFRLMHPAALIPATTALSTLAEDGRERGILAGANVVMPNLSPLELRGKYNLYDNKASSGAESSEGVPILAKRLESIGYNISIDRGDYKYV